MKLIAKLGLKETEDWKILPLYKVALCGKTEVGKTSIFRRLRGDGFKDDTSKFDHLAEAKINVPVQDKTIKIDLWDTSGMERYARLTRQHYFGSHVVLLVYDCDDMESLQALLDYYRDATRNASGAAMVLVRNKIDKVDQSVDIREAEKLLCNYEGMGRSACKFKFRAETSAKENTGIQELIQKVAEYLLKNAEPSNLRREFDKITCKPEPLPTRPTSGGCC
ncbi:uncharacterized protein LOC144630926 [Oculina patagonica]